MFKDIDELEAFMVKHGENIVDLMGGEIDRIELKLRVSSTCLKNIGLIIMLHGGSNSIKVFLYFFSLAFLIQCFLFFIFQTKYPEIRHCDLEIL